MSEKVINILKEVEAMLEGHFLLSSGKHSNRYFQCAKLLMHPDKAALVVEEIVKKLEGVDFDVIIGPAMGGIIVAYELGRQTGKPAMFSERENDVMALRRGFELKPGQKVIISEDVVTTGKSSMEVVKLIKEAGAEVVGIACLVDRTVEKVELPLYSAVKVEVQAFDKDDCPLCKDNIPYIKPGSRKSIS